MLSRRLFAATAAGAAAAAGAPALLAAEARAQTAPADSTMDRVKSSKVLRIAALPGEAPYFNKDLATGAWSGMCIDMAKDIAANFDGTVEYVESTYGNSVLDLQSNKIDLAFALNVMDWLAQDKALSSIRAKAITQRPITYGSESTPVVLQAVNIVGVPLAFILFGVARWRIRSSRRARAKL